MPKKVKEKKLYGYDIIQVNPIAIKGSERILSEKKTEIEEIFPPSLKLRLDKVSHFYELKSKAIELAKKFKDISIYELGEGGINTSLWDIHLEKNIGLRVEISDIFILRESIELTDYYSINPYELDSEGGLLLLCLDARKLIYALEEAGIFAKVIGKTVRENKVIIRGEGLRRTLKPPKKDSIYLLYK